MIQKGLILKLGLNIRGQPDDLLLCDLDFNAKLPDMFLALDITLFWVMDSDMFLELSYTSTFSWESNVQTRIFLGSFNI